MNQYICKYAPIEITAGFGEEYTTYNPRPNNFDNADRLIHTNVCSFSRALIEDRVTNDSSTLILTTCCDSINKAYDVLKNEGQKVFMINIPNITDHCSKLLYKSELLKFINEYSIYSGKEFDTGKFRNAFDNESDNITGPYISVMGARINDSLLTFIESHSPLPIKNNTCIGTRDLSLPPETNDLDELMAWYSDELLSQLPCMRMDNVTSRRSLVEDPHLKGIIYNTVSFCDFYSFEFAKLDNKLSIPMLKIETDYTNQGEGQMKTRLEAFFENTNSNKGHNVEKDVSINNRLDNLKDNNSKNNNNTKNTREYYVGIDSGSTSTNAVILDSEKNILSFSTIATGVKVGQSASHALNNVLEQAGLQEDQISKTVTTGYGRANIKFREKDVTEISCHAMGAHFLDPSVRTIIDIGGQDSKVIRLNEDGSVADFVMNDKCAAGTGRFLEMMASSLGISIEEMSIYGLKWKEDISISSMCSVFAQSEVVSLIAEDKSLEDIVHGINKSVASKVVALGKRGKIEPNYMMTGGVARNTGVVKAIEDKLLNPVIVPKEPDICGALGAALIASGI